METIRRAKIENISSRLPDQLSEKELAILRMLSHGMTDQEIAHKLFVSEVTVRTHISRIIRKLHLQNRVQAVLYSLRSGLVPESEIAQMTFDPYEPKNRGIEHNLLFPKTAVLLLTTILLSKEFPCAVSSLRFFSLAPG